MNYIYEKKKFIHASTDTYNWRNSNPKKKIAPSPPPTKN